MLHLITGNPGTKKTAFVVTKLDKIETNNKVNLVKNLQYYKDNLPLIEKFKDDFTYYEYEVGSGDELKMNIEVLSDDYFAMFELEEFENDLRPDDYFLRSVRFNEICERINEREGVQGFKGLLPVRTIYANIKALKIDYVRALKTDWRDCPDGSIIVIDEIQLVPPYDDLKKRDVPMIQELTIHRHRGFDFYFITQHPTLLHPTAKILIGTHWHLTVPFGWRTLVYQWGSTRDYPNTLINKINREARFDFNPPARIFKLYRSTTINTHQKRFPIKMALTLLFFILCCIAVIFSQVNKAKQSSLIEGKKVVAGVSSTAVTSSASATVVTSAPAVTSSPTFTSAPAVTALPTTEQVYQQKIQSLPTSFISFGAKCTAYNRDGLPLDMTATECKQYASGIKKVAIQIVSAHQDFTPAPAVAPSPVVMPVSTSAVTASREYAFNADNSHEQIFKDS